MGYSNHQLKMLGISNDVNKESIALPFNESEKKKKPLRHPPTLPLTHLDPACAFTLSADDGLIFMVQLTKENPGPSIFQTTKLDLNHHLPPPQQPN